MTDYISRDEIKKALAEKCRECEDACEEFDGIMPDCTQCLMYGAGKSILSIPAADVREVVLCRNCANGEWENQNHTYAWCNLWNEWKENWWFCASGIKRGADMRGGDAE